MIQWNRFGREPDPVSLRAISLRILSSIGMGGLVLIVAFLSPMAIYAQGSTEQLNQQPILFKETEVSVDAKGTALFGSLLVPAGSARKSCLAILHAGSGPTDRNGNPPGATHPGDLRLIAEYLAGSGFATLRIDKRGTGKSVPPDFREEDLRFSTYVKDLGIWVESMRKSGHQCVVLVGHSEGALISAMAAAEQRVNALVSVSGVALPASVLLRAQLKGRLDAQLEQKSEEILVGLESGRTMSDIPAALMILYRPSVQNYLIEWFSIDPMKAYEKFQGRTLIIHGSDDRQIPSSHAGELAKAGKNATVKIIEGMGHSLSKRARVAPDSERRVSVLNPALGGALVEHLSIVEENR